MSKAIDAILRTDDQMMDKLEAEIESLREALVPLAMLSVPKNAKYNAGAYSIRHSDIERARRLLATPPLLAKDAS